MTAPAATTCGDCELPLTSAHLVCRFVASACCAVCCPEYGQGDD